MCSQGVCTCKQDTSGGVANMEADVIIVGSGLSGLTTAYRLVNLGATVLILEASGSVGGRARSTELNTPEREQVAVGGTWAAFETTETLSLSYEVDCLPIMPQPSFIKALYVSEKITSSPWLLIKLWFLGRQIVKAGKADGGRWWASDAARRLDAISLDEWLASCKWCTESCREAVREWFNNLETFDETSRVSALFAATMLYYRLKGLSRRRPLRWESGTGRFVDALVATLRASKRAHIIAGSAVVAIDQATLPNKVIVTTQTGTKFIGKRVVMAMSPPASGTIQYTPALPAEAMRLMKSMVATLYPSTNIIVRYRSPWWVENGFGALVLPRHTTAPANGLFGPMMDLSPLPTAECPHPKGILRVLTTPQRVAGLAPDKLREAVIAYLQSYYPSEFAEKISEIESIDLFDWATEAPHIPGVTYFFPPGVLSHYGDWIRKPIGRIYFGGAERSTHGQNWMEGAIERGNRVAADIADSLGINPAEDEPLDANGALRDDQSASTGEPAPRRMRLNKRLFRMHTNVAVQRIFGESSMLNGTFLHNVKQAASKGSSKGSSIGNAWHMLGTLGGMVGGTLYDAVTSGISSSVGWLTTMLRGNGWNEDEISDSAVPGIATPPRPPRHRIRSEGDKRESNSDSEVEKQAVWIRSCRSAEELSPRTRTPHQAPNTNALLKARLTQVRPRSNSDILRSFVSL